ncbi:MAG: PEP-CTERM sorting domain-containing protein [Acidobacteriota bacterium]
MPLIAFCLALPANAETIFQATATGCGSFTGSSAQSGGYVEHAVSGGTCDGAGSVAEGKAFAGPTALGAYGLNQHFGAGSGTTGGGTATLCTEFNIIASLGTPIGTPVPVGLNLELHSIGLDPLPNSQGTFISLTIDLYIGAFTTGRRLAWRTSDGRSFGAGGMNVPNLNGDTFLVADPVEVLYGAPRGLSISLEAFALGAGADNSGELVSINALNTLRLPRTGPVFNLPDGYSVDAPGLFVFNNRFVDPNGGGGSEVPEPATFGLVAAGLALAAKFRRKR